MFSSPYSPLFLLVLVKNKGQRRQEFQMVLLVLFCCKRWGEIHFKLYNIILLKQILKILQKANIWIKCFSKYLLLKGDVLEKSWTVILIKSIICNNLFSFPFRTFFGFYLHYFFFSFYEWLAFPGRKSNGSYEVYFC